ncbi:MAG: sialidase family protein [Vicinamibacteria bacterium]
MKLTSPIVSALGALTALAGSSTAGAATRDPVVAREFVYERAPFPSAHASTIVETPSGLVAAWFGGTAERHPDVCIWLARRGAGGWSAPVEVARCTGRDGRPAPCWNPVLFQPSRGPLVLFYKSGPSPSEWWGLARTSSDDGRTWSAEIALPPGILGPIRAKPVELDGGVVLAGSSTEDHGWVVHMERWTPPELASPKAWERGPRLHDPTLFEAIQPTLLVHSPGEIQALCRSRQKVITELWSRDGGRTWGSMTATPLPNPSAGIDAVRLSDGRFLLVYNPLASGRGTLALAVSSDGRAWREAAILEKDDAGEYSYPAMIQSKDGRVHVTYTWRRERIRHVTIEPTSIR